MKRILLTLILLFSGQEYISAQIYPLVQATTKAGSTSLAFGKNVTASNILVVCMTTAGSITAVADTLTNTWTDVGNETANSVNIRCWDTTTSSGGADTAIFTCTCGDVTINLMEFDGSMFTSTVDVKNVGSVVTSTSFSTTNLTTTINGDLLIAVGGNDSSSWRHPTSSLTFVTTNSRQSSMATGYTITGAPGTYNATFNQSSATAEWVQFTLKPVAMNIFTTSLPVALASSPYSYQLTGQNGIASYTWSLSSGSLPTGLSLSSSGLISGTPTGATTTPTFRLTDGTTTVTKVLTLTVNSNASTITPTAYSLSSGTYAAGTLTSGTPLCVLQRGDDSNGISSANTRPIDNVSTIYYYINSGVYVNSSTAVWSNLWCGILASNGTITITPNTADALEGGMVIVFSGGQGFFDGDITTILNAAATTLTSNSVSTVMSNSLLWVGASVLGGTPNWTAGSGFTLLAGYPSLCSGGGIGTSCGMEQQYKIESTTGSFTPAFTISSSFSWGMIAMGIRPSTNTPFVPAGGFPAVY